MAEAKLEVYNADGSLQFSTAHRLFRTLLQIDTGTADGSVMVPIVPGNVIVQRAAKAEDKAEPGVTVASGSVSWSFGSTAAAQRGDTRLTVVVY